MDKILIKSRIICMLNKSFTRLKSKNSVHWAKLARKKFSKDRALEHFDDFYGSVFNERWKSIRLALLSPHKYCAVVNNFGDTDKTMSILENFGALNIRTLFELQRENLKLNAKEKLRSEQLDKIYKLDSKLEQYLAVKQQQEVTSVYSRNETDIKSLQNNDELINTSENEPKISNEDNKYDLSLQTRLQSAEYDESRIIDPELGLSSSALHEFIPASKLKGMEDWILESDHYQYYDSSKLPVSIEPEHDLHFPENLNIYSFERGNISTFKSPGKGSTGVFNYFLLDGSSILPVLALGLKPGDKVLDMCSAPGGKAFIMLQTLYPDCIVCNDIAESRMKRITNVLQQYLYDYDKWKHRVFVTKGDGRVIEDVNMYDKILVDVPCTTDRHSVMENDNNIFKSTRLKERLRLPEIQASLLSNALKLVRVGGTVVYSTCSLSPIQNDGVVQMALKKVTEESNIRIVVKDLAPALEPTKCLYKIESKVGLKYGHLVVPFLPNNFGPMYFCKLVRTN